MANRKPIDQERQDGKGLQKRMWERIRAQTEPWLHRQGAGAEPVMANRKPIDQERQDGKGLRQRVWERIRAQTEPWKKNSVIMGGENSQSVRDYLTGLERGGYIRVAREIPDPVSDKRPCTKLYELAKDNGVEAPRVRRDGTLVTQGLAQEQMWRTLRMSKADTNARELAAHASTDQVPVDEKAASDYLRNLNKGGYLICTAKGHGIGKGGIQARYKLDTAKDTGPKPPMVCRTKALFDPNLGEIVWQPAITEEDAIYG
jgi:hypothetical protein